MDAMLDRMSARDVAEWQAYATLDPFGEERADFRAAIIACTVASAMGAKRCKPSDFMPLLDKQPAEPQSEERMWQTCKAFAAAFGGKK